MKLVSTKAIFTLGFLTILILLSAVMALWIVDLDEHNERLQHIVDEQAERELVSAMRDIIYQRAITLHRMADMTDPFDRDEEYMAFGELAQEFIKKRNEAFSSMGENRVEKQLWQDIKPDLNKGGQLQNRAADLILDDKIDEASTLLIDEVAPTQKVVMDKLKQIFNVQRDDIQEDMEKAKDASITTYRLVTFFGSVAVLLAMFTVFVVKRTGKTEKALVDQGERIRALYDVTATAGITADEQINEMLRLGCQFLSMDMGKVGRIDADENTNTVLNVYSTHKTDLHAGAVLVLNKTFCNIVFSSDSPIAVNDVAHSELNKSECYEATHLESYIATPIYLYGNKYGTINFSRVKARSSDFSDVDKDLVSLIGSWISVTLEHKFSEKALVDAKEAAEDAVKTKSSFLSKMSHELRTPLNAIIGYSDLLMEEAKDTQAGTEEDLSKIKSSGIHLLSLINDVLDLSSIDAQQMKLEAEDFSVDNIIDTVSNVIQPLVRQNNNSYHCKVSPELSLIHADKRKLKQILLNLLNNASRYTKNGNIALEVNQIRENGANWVVFSVIDTGAGISPEQQEGIFQSFSQIEKTGPNNTAGAGLGLAISRKLARMMGGDITVSSTVGSGSVFSVVLPTTRPESNKTSPLKLVGS